MWQKLRLYCACRWGRARRPTGEAHAGLELGVSALSSDCLNLVHREERVCNLLPPTYGQEPATSGSSRFNADLKSGWPPKSQVLWPV